MTAPEPPAVPPIWWSRERHRITGNGIVKQVNPGYLVGYTARESAVPELPADAVLLVPDTTPPTGEMPTGQAFLDAFYTPSVPSTEYAMPGRYTCPSCGRALPCRHCPSTSEEADNG